MPHAVDGMKVCTICMENLPVDRFPRARNLLDGLHTQCKECKNAGQKAFYYANHEQAKERQIWRTLKHRYGVTRDQYEAKLAEQGGTCAICGQAETTAKKFRLCVDHNHQTGEVRGLLCLTCNAAIGYLKEKPELFANAAAYLRKWSPSR